MKKILDEQNNCAWWIDYLATNDNGRAIHNADKLLPEFIGRLWFWFDEYAECMATI